MGKSWRQERIIKGHLQNKVASRVFIPQFHP